MTDNYLNDIKKEILSLSEFEWNNIYDIIIKHNIKHTKNKNGVFLNMRDLDDPSISHIETIIKNYKQSIYIQEQREKELLKYNNKN